MSERDLEFLELCGLIAMLGIASILQVKIMKRQQETLIRHDEDITFLRLVTRGLEEKVAE